MPDTSNATKSKYTFSDLKTLWINAGGNPNYASIAAAVAIAESGGNPKSVSQTQDVGLWQINKQYHPQLATTDPVGNAKAAISLSDNGSNWRAWCTAYTDGACGTKGGKYSLTDSPVGTALSRNGGGAVPGSDTNGATDTGTAQTIGNPIWDLFSNLFGDNPVSNFFNELFSTVLGYIAIGAMFVGGAALMVIGLYILLLDSKMVREGLDRAEQIAAISAK